MKNVQKKDPFLTISERSELGLKLGGKQELIMKELSPLNIEVRGFGGDTKSTMLALIWMQGWIMSLNLPAVL